MAYFKTCSLAVRVAFVLLIVGSALAVLGLLQQPDQKEGRNLRNAFAHSGILVTVASNIFLVLYIYVDECRDGNRFKAGAGLAGFFGGIFMFLGSTGSGRLVLGQLSEYSLSGDASRIGSVIVVAAAITLFFDIANMTCVSYYRKVNDWFSPPKTSDYLGDQEHLEDDTPNEHSGDLSPPFVVNSSTLVQGSTATMSKVIVDKIDSKLYAIKSRDSLTDVQS